MPVTIGSNTFIPGFEDQLIGIGVGETRTLKVSFPKNYGSDKLAGLFSVALILSGRATRKQQIPFGPFMITGAFLVILAAPGSH